MKELDVIVTVTTRTDDLSDLHRQRRKSLTAAGYEPVFVYVLDGESPYARAQLVNLGPEDGAVQVVQLSRRFGETAATLAGFASTTAERVLLLPSFAQVETAALGSVVDALDHADLATARRFPRCDSRARRAQSWIFERFVSFAGTSKFRDPGCTVHALRREVLVETQLYGEQHGFLPLLAANIGFKVVEIDVPQARRDASRSMQPPRTYLHRIIDILSIFFLTRFTRRPLRFFGPIGATCAALGFAGLAVLAVQRVVLGQPLADRPALILFSLLLAVGLQVLAIGLIGELIVFIHAKSMKQYRVRDVVEAVPARDRPVRLTQVGVPE
jgi:hypothetical protein